MYLSRRRGVKEGCVLSTRAFLIDGSEENAEGRANSKAMDRQVIDKFEEIKCCGICICYLMPKAE